MIQFRYVELKAENARLAPTTTDRQNSGMSTLVHPCTSNPTTKSGLYFCKKGKVSRADVP